MGSCGLVRLVLRVAQPCLGGSGEDAHRRAERDQVEDICALTAERAVADFPVRSPNPTVVKAVIV